MKQRISKQFIPVKTFEDDLGKHIVYPNFQKITTNKIIPDKSGQVQLKIIFYKKYRNPITFFGYSRIRKIYEKQQYLIAKVEAFNTAYYYDVPFSPDNYEIIGEKFIYIDSYNYPLFENSPYAVNK